MLLLQAIVQIALVYYHATPTYKYNNYRIFMTLTFMRRRVGTAMWFGEFCPDVPVLFVSFVMLYVHKYWLTVQGHWRLFSCA